MSRRFTRGHRSILASVTYGSLIRVIKKIDTLRNENCQCLPDAIQAALLVECLTVSLKVNLFSSRCRLYARAISPARKQSYALGTLARVPSTSSHAGGNQLLTATSLD